MPAQPERFGKYHLLSRLAQGGMAEVYKVKTVGIAGFEKVQALKKILPALARQPRFIRSFVDEARIAVQLTHRNIVQVFDFGKASGELFLSMELIDGIDLRTLLADAGELGTRLSVPLACYIASEVGHGLDYAHNKVDAHGESLGIVHCDVSPQNLMLSYEGYVKILDFGVARARIVTQEWSRRLRGKPRYMAPEQTRGDQPTTATDVFALGIVTWEMLTGLPLFEGHDLKSLLQAVRRADAPPADRLNPEVPADVSAAVARALSPRPADRGTAAELATCLSRTAQMAMPPGNARSLAQWMAKVYREREEQPGQADAGPGRTGGPEPGISPGARERMSTVTVTRKGAPPRMPAPGKVALHTVPRHTVNPDLSLERRVTTPWTAVMPEGSSEMAPEGWPEGSREVGNESLDLEALSAQHQESLRARQRESGVIKTQTIDFGEFGDFGNLDDAAEPGPQAPDISLDASLDTGLDAGLDMGLESGPDAARDRGQGVLGPNTTTVIIERDQRMENIDDEDDDVDPSAPNALMEKRRVVVVAVLVDEGTPESRQELTQLLGDLAYKHGAVLHEEGADGLVAVFGLEIAGEDDVAKAMGYALDAVEVAREARASASKAGQEVMTMRMAARTNIVAAPTERGGYRLVGNAVDETRALARSADPSRPLLGGTAGRLTSTYYAFREVPARRHQRRRMRVLELIGPRSFDERDRTLLARTGRFIGRYRELAMLSQALERASREGERVTVALIGTAGVGKSRLLSEFVARVEAAEQDEKNSAVVAVAAMPGAETAPFTLLIDLVQGALGLPPERGEAARGRLSRRVRQALARGAMSNQEIEDVVGTLETAMELRDGVLLTGLHTSSDLRERVLGAWYAVQMAIARPERTALSILEDVHLADQTSVEVLRESLASASLRPELIVLSAAPDTEIARTIGEWVDQVVVLSELAGSDLELLIEDRLADAATSERVAAIAQRAGGNPLFVEQLATEARDVGEIPPTVRAVVTARTDRLSAGAKAVLQHAAVMGPVVRAPILEELVDRDIAAELMELIDEELLVREEGTVQAGQESVLRFAAHLVREVVYDSLSATARKTTHRTLGQVLAARHRAGRDESPANVAEHLEKGGLERQASAFWLRAGRVALAAGDGHAAVERFSRTLAIEDRDDRAETEPTSPASVGIPGIPGSAERDKGDAARNRVRGALEGREQANRQIGDHEAQSRDLERLHELAADASEMLADVNNRQAIFHLRTGDFKAAVDATEKAEIAARSCLDELAMGESLRIRGEAFERLGDFDRAMEITRQARAIFERVGARYEETTAMIGIGRNHLFAARYEEALAEYGQIVERVEESGDPWLERVVRNHVSIIHLCLGRYDEAMFSARRAVEISRRHGDRAREGDSLSVCGIIAFEIGLLDKAYAFFTRALAILERTHSRWSRADCLVYAGATLCASDDFERGFELLDEAESLAHEIGAKYVRANALIAMARAGLDRGARGDIALAERTTESAIELARESKLVGPFILGLSRRAEAFRARGRLDEARTLSGQAVSQLESQRHMEGSEQEVYFTNHLIARDTGDSWAGTALERAHGEVERKLECMSHDEWRRAFSQNVRINRAILEASERELEATSEMDATREMD